MAGLIGTLRFHAERLAATAAAGHALATDLAELLVRRGTPFREAHEVVGHLVVWCQVHDCELADVSDADLDKVSPLLTPGRAGGADGAGRDRGPRRTRRHRAGPGRGAARQAAAGRARSGRLGRALSRSATAGLGHARTRELPVVEPSS